MFSGIRMLIFGYSEPESTKVEENTDPSKSYEGSGLSSIHLSSIDTSALLEQTLNAATSKLTQQLLPASPSIEQLQSSCRQLLPSLNEQHEEDETNKKKFNEVQTEKESDDDDECFNADSWELLDLVDKPDLEVSIAHSTAQDEISNIKQASGILKSSNKTSLYNSEAVVQARQKPKVSFETPDLVSAAQTIDLNKPKLKTKNKKNKKAKIVTQKDNTSELNSKIQSERETISKKTTKGKGDIETLVAKTPVSVQPILNYAAALTMKLNKTELVKEKTAKQGNTMSKDRVDNEPTISGAVKRNRPVSTSSWSSSDENDSTNLIWKNVPDANENVEKKKETYKSDNVSSVSDDDVESILSSGFSNFDYDYHELNDYVMRPKKTQNKRRGYQSTSSSLLSSMSKRGSERDMISNGNRKCFELQESQQKSVEYNKSKRLTPKQAKSKKKKLVPSSTYRISHEQAPFVDISEAKITSSDPLKASANILKYSPKAKIELVRERVDDAAILMPPPSSMTPPSIMASSSSGDDSSNIAEMDESWFVTPPPCFTGSNKLDNSKQKTGKEAARENELIEHPSIYLFDVEDWQKSKPCVKSRKLKKRIKSANISSTFLSRAETPDNFELQADFEADLLEPSPALIGLTDESTSSSLSVELIAQAKPELVEIQNNCKLDENADPHQTAVVKEDLGTSNLERPSVKSYKEKKASIAVQPIEPERQPGWQLRRKRSKRRPLSSSVVNTSTTAPCVRQQQIKGNSQSGSELQQLASSGSNQSSARSSPNLIDRIGSSIVANLTNLTNGFPTTGISISARSAVGEAEKLSQSVVRKSSFESNIVSRRRISKGYMNRQNDIAKMANSNRRADRRLKMHSTPNGVSINRKVHTNFH